MDHIRSVLTGGPSPIARRDTFDCRDEDGWPSTDICPNLSFWWTRTGYIVKWSLFLGLTTLLLVYLLVGYLHAKSRLKKGLAPLGYHRFLVARRDLARVDPRYQFPPPNNVYYYEQQPGGPGGPAPAYGMYAMPPPPVYDPNAPRPPVYQYDVEAGAGSGSAQPPAGATKVDPSQSAADPVRRPADQQAEQYEAPPGPPPPPFQSQNTGSTNPFRN